MAIDPVNVGTAPNSGNGDPQRTAFQKLNASIAYLLDLFNALASSLSNVTNTSDAAKYAALIRGGVTNLSLSVSAASSALTIALKDIAGNNPSSGSPAYFNFKSATLTDSKPVQRALTAASSIVIPSSATLGIASATAARVWIVLFDDAGTLRPGVINCALAAGVFPLQESGVASSTAISSGATSAGVFYTGTAVTNKPYVILGYAEWSAAGMTAGTWTATNLLEVKLFGPGVKRPGDVVQSAFGSSNTGTTTSSTSYVATNVAASIAPTSAANLIEVEWDGNLNATDTSTYGNGFIGIHRDSTLVGGHNAGIYAAASSGAFSSQLSGVVADEPNSVASISYNVRVRAGHASQSVSYPYNGFAGHLRAREIMR